jgi:hypothetical protein
MSEVLVCAIHVIEPGLQNEYISSRTMQKEERTYLHGDDGMIALRGSESDSSELSISIGSGSGSVSACAVARIFCHFLSPILSIASSQRLSTGPQFVSENCGVPGDSVRVAWSTLF